MSARPDLTTEELIAALQRLSDAAHDWWNITQDAPLKVQAAVNDTEAIAQRLRAERPAPCTFKAFGKFPCELPEGHDGDHIWRALREMRESLMHGYPPERPAVTPEERKCVVCEQPVTEDESFRFESFDGYYHQGCDFIVEIPVSSTEGKP